MPGTIDYTEQATVLIRPVDIEVAPDDITWPPEHRMTIAHGADQLPIGQDGALDEAGIKFWSAVYIPIVVAMAAQQNVYGALAGGPMAILAGVAAVALAFMLVPVLDRIGRKKLEADPTLPADPAKPLTSSARG